MRPVFPSSGMINLDGLLFRIDVAHSPHYKILSLMQIPFYFLSGGTSAIGLIHLYITLPTFCDEITIFTLFIAYGK